MNDKAWSLQDAKNRFSALVERALSGVPQRVNRRGKPAVVVVAVEDYERLLKVERSEAPGLADYLLAMPQDDGEFERHPVEPRDIDLSCT